MFKVGLDSGRALSLVTASNPNTRFGALVSQKHKEKILSYIDNSEGEGTRLVCHFKFSAPDNAGFCVPRVATTYRQSKRVRGRNFWTRSVRLLISRRGRCNPAVSGDEHAVDDAKRYAPESALFVSKQVIGVRSQSSLPPVQVSRYMKEATKARKDACGITAIFDRIATFVRFILFAMFYSPTGVPALWAFG